MPATATPAQRDAQKRIVGILNANMVLNRGGLALWREDYDHDLYMSANADEVIEALAELGVTATAVPRIMPPRAKERRARKGREVRVPWNELATLIHWTPALKKRMDGLDPDCPTVHEFVFFEPTPQAMKICLASFAARWPWWTVKEATRMGLMCATCGWDLRQTTEDEDRLAYRIPEAEGRLRFYCGGCCNHGLDYLGLEEDLTPKENTVTRTLPDVTFARIADKTGRHIFFWAAPTTGMDELLVVWNRVEGMTAEPYTVTEPAIVTAAQAWLADKLREHDKPTVMIGSIERGKWIDWNLPSIPRPALPTI